MGFTFQAIGLVSIGGIQGFTRWTVVLVGGEKPDTKLVKDFFLEIVCFLSDIVILWIATRVSPSFTSLYAEYPP